MLPPPITRPTPAPISPTALISLARRLMISKSNVCPLSPASASPESLRRMRLYFSGFLSLEYTGKGPDTCSRLAELVPDEATDHDVLADLRRRLLHEVADALLRLLDPGLREQRDVLVVRLHLALDHLLDDLLGLAALARLLLEDPALAVDGIGRHAGLVDGEGRH